MEDANPMTQSLKLPGNMRADEFRCANQQNPHHATGYHEEAASNQRSNEDV
jgi:hypothetical protein